MLSTSGWVDAVAWARSIRSERAEFVDRCGSDLDLDAVRAAVGATEASDAVTSLRLLTILEAMPAIGGKVASRRLMAATGLA